MMGEGWANFAAKVFSWTTDANGLAALQKRLTIERLKKDIKDAIYRKDYALAARKLADLQRVSDAV